VREVAGERDVGVRGPREQLLERFLVTDGHPKV
jgi:hypothetical protein